MLKRLLCAASLASAAAVVAAVSAVAQCDPYATTGNPQRLSDPGFSYSPLFSGGINWGRAGVPTDSEATITYYTPFVDSRVHGGDAAWTMLASGSECSTGFVQAGVFHPYYGPSFSQIFYEWEDCNTTFGGQAWPQGGPVTHHFKAQHSGSNPGVVTAYMDNIQMFANQTISWRPNSVQNFSETHSPDDQNYGGVNTQQSFTNMIQCDGSGCYGNASFCLVTGSGGCGLSQNAPWMMLRATGSPAWVVWDRDCPS